MLGALTVYEYERHWSTIVLVALTVLTLVYCLEYPVNAAMGDLLFSFSRMASRWSLVRMFVVLVSVLGSVARSISLGEVKALLTLPVRRRDLFLVKYVFGLAVLSAAFTVPFMLVFYRFLSAPLAQLIALYLVETAFSWSAAFLLALTLTNPVASFLASGILLLSLDVAGSVSSDNVLQCLNSYRYYEGLARALVFKQEGLQPPPAATAALKPP